MPDNGTTAYPGDDDLNLPLDETIAPTLPGDGHYTFKEWHRRVTGFIRSIYADFVLSHKTNANAHHNRLHDLASASDHTVTADVDFGAHKAKSSATPSASNDLANKAYVDASAQGLSPKASVKGASTTNHSVAAYSGSTIDGGSVSLSTGDRILLKDQSTGSQNGIWVFNGAGSALTRPADFTAGSQQAGAFVFVESGTANAASGWVLASTAITVDTTAQTWTQFSGAGEITAGSGLAKSGNILSVPTAGITSTMIADGTIVDADIAAGAAIAQSKIAGLGGAASLNVGTATGTVAAGDDSRFSLAATQYMRTTSDFSKGGAATGGGSGDTTLANVAGMSFALGINEVWQFEVVVFHDGSTTGDIKLAWTTPTGATIIWSGNGLSANATSDPSSEHITAVTAGGSATTFGTVGVGTKLGMVLRGLVVADASHSGTVQLQMAQGAADGTNATTVYTNTHGRAVRTA